MVPPCLRLTKHISSTWSSHHLKGIALSCVSRSCLSDCARCLLHQDSVCLGPASLPTLSKMASSSSKGLLLYQAWLCSLIAVGGHRAHPCNWLSLPRLFCTFSISDSWSHPPPTASPLLTEPASRLSRLACKCSPAVSTALPWVSLLVPVLWEAKVEDHLRPGV